MEKSIAFGDGFRTESNTFFFVEKLHGWKECAIIKKYIGVCGGDEKL